MSKVDRIAVIYKNLAGRITNLVIVEGSQIVANIHIAVTTEEETRQVAKEHFGAIRVHVAQEIENWPEDGGSKIV